MMNREFTPREKVLLLVLVLLLIGLGYFKIIHEPVQEAMLTAAERRNEAETATTVEVARLQQMRAMEEELAQLKAEGNEANAELPDYDNVQSVMSQLNAILATAREYELTFDEVQIGEEGLVARPIRLSFIARNYRTARIIINKLYHCRFRCGLSDITVLCEETDVSTEPVEVHLTVTFYERKR